MNDKTLFPLLNHFIITYLINMSDNAYKAISQRWPLLGIKRPFAVCQSI